MTDKSRQRLAALFADIERLAGHPDAGTEAIQRELEALRARVAEMEARILHDREPASSTRAGSPALYEKEQVGYVYAGTRLESMPSSAIETPRNDHNVLQLPLVGTDGAIGRIVAEPPPQRGWTKEDASLAEAIAQRASLQIQSLRLLTAAEQARAEAEAASRRFIHESWASFLDGIRNNERIGYLYDQAEVAPVANPNVDEADIHETIEVLDEHIGSLLVKSDPARPPTHEDKAMVSAVARQVAQQVENLRLLAEAARARAEAEEAARRLTREEWREYSERAKKKKKSLGFLYDSNQVQPLSAPPSSIDLSHPIVVRGEAIGQLAVSGLGHVSPEMTEIVSAIAAQASIHIETLRLTEELQQRAEELMELDRLKSSFLANMSHELRTPLNSILGFADVMIEGLDGPLTPNMDNDLKLIQKNGQHLLHLINDVLDMAKIESGTLNLTVETFNLNEIIEEVTGITGLLASDKRIALVIEPDSDREVEISADRTRLRQVLINIVTNAIKFTEKGKISLRAVCEKNNVLVAVKDTGIGIPADQLETIFQEFTQVDSSTTRKAGGTGLGLPISRRLIEMHGGRLWAESSGVEGEGSTFYIFLPIEAKIADPEPVTRGK
ncbi:MAG: sensor histidine kinase [Anaerolineaceae bacterium]|jgi:signal transduction histidine kinase|nr:MAG: sensor histidine kinase [Anaerolineaceae bacterium]